MPYLDTNRLIEGALYTAHLNPSQAFNAIYRQVWKYYYIPDSLETVDFTTELSLNGLCIYNRKALIMQ